MKIQVSVSEEGVLWSWSISADRVKCFPPQYKSTKSNSDDGQARSQAILMRVTVLPYRCHFMSSGLNARPAPPAIIR